MPPKVSQARITVPDDPRLCCPAISERVPVERERRHSQPGQAQCLLRPPDAGGWIDRPSVDRITWTGGSTGTRAVRLADHLHPQVRVEQWVTGIGGGTPAHSTIRRVAPILGIRIDAGRRCPRALALERYLHGGHADGVIIVSDHGPVPLRVSIPAMGLPATVIGRPLEACGLPYVDADNRGGARQAVEYLVRQGRRRIAHIAGPSGMTVGADRLSGFREAMANAGLGDQPVAFGDFGQLAGVHAMDRLLDQRPRIDAVFAASDAMAAGAVRALTRTGRAVPDDVAVVGFDDMPLALQVRPALTTVRQPIEECGARAVGQLAGGIRIDGGLPPAALILPTALITRESA